MNRKVLFGGLLALLWSASNALAQSVPDVRFSEIHYDNTGTDAGEAIEVSGPAGTDVSGWQIVLYNGNGGGTYIPIMTLSGAFPATCGARGVMVLNYPVNGIQNGDPDGFALVDATGSVVEFLSYEGTFTATNGPASGRASVDIGVREAGNEPVGLSLARTSAGNWNAPAGSCVTLVDTSLVRMSVSRSLTTCTVSVNARSARTLKFTSSVCPTSAVTVRAWGLY
jgi:hypothetical protein